MGSREQLETVRIEDVSDHPCRVCHYERFSNTWWSPQKPPTYAPETVPLGDPIGKPDERTKKLISKGALVSGWPHLAGA